MLAGRVDDNEKTAAKRIETFHRMGCPTLEALRTHDVPVHVLDGCQSPEQVWQQLLALGTPLTRWLG